MGLLLAGAFVALFADALWDNRADRRAEAEYIASIEEDLRDTASDLDEMEEFYHEVLRADSIVIAYAQGSSDLEQDSILSATMRAFMLWYPRPALDTYQDMIASGNLHLIQNAEIRKGLATFAAEVVVLQETVGVLLERWATLEEPFILDQLPVLALYDGYPRGVAIDQQERIGTLSLPSGDLGPESVPRSRELANHIAMRMVLVYDVLLSIEWLREDLRELQARLSASTA